jgi:glycosyltransferase involved in cell wall biosynthesis
MRVCIVAGRYPPDFAGHGIQIQSLLPHLERLGVSARVVTRRPEPGVSWPSHDAGVVQRILPVERDPLSRLRALLTLRAHFRREHRCYDVVHVALHDWEMCLNLPYLKRLGLPLLFEMVLLGSDDPLTLRAGRLGALRLRLLRHVDLWVGIADAFRPSLVQAGIPEERFRRVYTAVDVERFRPVSEARRRELRAAQGIPADARVVVTVGALLPRKGIDRLLEAWARLAPRPGRDLLLVVGPASEAEGLRPRFLEHARSLRERAARPDLAGTVRFTGRADHVETWMGAADVFAFLSRREGFGTVSAEAMCSGLPCVISPLDGIGQEIVDEGESGFVIGAPDDPEAVAARLAELLGDPGLRLRMGRAAVERGRERFSMQGRAQRLVELYQGLARGRRT